MILVALSLVLMVFLLDLRTRALCIRGGFPDDADKYYLPPPKYLQVVSLGYREAAADLVWIATIQHAADRRLYSGRRFPWLERYLDAVLALNPYLPKVYLWADATLTYGRSEFANGDFKRSIHYLKIGHRHFPRRWEFLFKLACAYTELRTKDRDRRSRWMRLAADYLWKAHLVGGGPPWLGSLAARYWSEEGRWQLAYRRALEEFMSTDNPAIRKEMSDRLASLLSQSSGGMSVVAHFARLAVPTVGNPGALGLFLVGDLVRSQRVFFEAKSRLQKVTVLKERFDRDHARCLPYVSSDLYALLGPCAALAASADDASPLPAGDGQP